jgi:hypothetical protein
MRVRRPAAAGTFYPGDPLILARTVDRLLDDAKDAKTDRPWGLVAPHAGYRYSGPVAATAYAAARPWADRIARVVVLGPAHFVPLEGCAAPVADAWGTPLGDVGIDLELRAEAVAAGCVLDDEPHVPEHSLEVQLPFLQRLFGPEVRTLPVAVGRMAASAASAVLQAVAGSADLVVVSTDLSHHLDLVSARVADRRTADAILTGDPAEIGPRDACGVFALRGLMAYASATGRVLELLDLRTSGDTAGDPTRVVGYGAFTVGEAGRSGIRHRVGSVSGPAPMLRR